MNNTIVQFSNAEFGNIRGLLIDGAPWFIGKDVAEALGYTDTDQALRIHVDSEDKLTRKINGAGQRRNMSLINESGLYSLILRSNLESAKKFKRWVTAEVLPDIRKTGSYSVQNEPRWFETRQNTKTSHKPFTAAIKLMIDYLKQFGEFHKEGYVYGHITNIVQNAGVIVKGQRDSSPVANLNKCDQCQNMIATLILNLIARRQAKSLSEFVSLILVQLNNLNNLLGGIPVALLAEGA